MSITAHDTGDAVHIKIVGVFDYSTRSAFRQACGAFAGDRSFVIDFGEVDAIDSTALGMLLMLRENSGGDDADITIVNCGEMVSNVLKLANFQSLFHIP